MPIRQKDALKSAQLNIDAAFEVDNDVTDSDQLLAQGLSKVASRPEISREQKTAIIQVAIYPSWRKHFHVEAAKRGEKLAPIALKALIDRYGIPEE